MLVQVALERQRFFDRVEVLTLQVFHNRQLGNQPIVRLPDAGGNLRPAGMNRRPQTTFATDQLESVVDFANHQRLEHVVLLEALGQRSNLRLAKIPPRLEWVLVDLVYVQQDHLTVTPVTRRLCVRWCIAMRLSPGGYLVASMQRRMFNDVRLAQQGG